MAFSIQIGLHLFTFEPATKNESTLSVIVDGPGDPTFLENRAKTVLSLITNDAQFAKDLTTMATCLDTVQRHELEKPILQRIESTVGVTWPVGLKITGQAVSDDQIQSDGILADKTACDEVFEKQYDPASDSYIVTGKILKSSAKAYYFELIDPSLMGVVLPPQWLSKSMVIIDVPGDIVKVKITRWLFEERYEKPLLAILSKKVIQSCEVCGELAGKNCRLSRIDSGQLLCDNCRIEMQKS